MPKRKQSRAADKLRPIFGRVVKESLTTVTKIDGSTLLPFMPARFKDAPDSELRSLLIVYGWEPSKEGAATWLMRIMERLDRAENPPNTKRLRTDDPPRGGSTQDALVGGDS